MRAERRQFIGYIGGSVMLIGTAVSLALAQPAGRLIKINAKKFEFTPSKIELKLNEPVIFELSGEEVMMGISFPDFNLRVDITPGKLQTLHLIPDKIGTFEFVCDVFCGSGHEEMSGVIVVT